MSPDVRGFARALAALARGGVEFVVVGVGGINFYARTPAQAFATLDFDDDAILRRVVERGANVSAIHPEAGQIDLLTSVAGFDYAALDADATGFDVAGTRIRVGRLEKLLASKAASGRAKDRAFLAAFEASRAEEDPDGSPRD